MASKPSLVYFFGNGKADGTGKLKELLGGKGAGLAEMTRIGLPVPAGFTITTEACAHFHKRDGKWPTGLEKQIRQMVTKLERACKKKLGDRKDPLLVSVRSGAAKSMPGMMETILNLGLNDESVEGLANVSSSRRFAFDAYRRFIMMYGATAKGIERELFDEAFDRMKETTATRLGKTAGEKIQDTDINADELVQIVGEFKDIYRQHSHEEFPQDPFEQLRGAIDAVFGSWMLDKAITYRKVEHITGLNGTAVNICQMVFGNMGDDCGTGVCFTRDPSTGEPTFYGDYLINAQGEDVVAGVRTPLQLETLSEVMPEVYEQLEAVRVMLEVHFKEMQDLEFTIERNKLYMLQCRTGKRSPQAAFRIAVDQTTKGLMTASRAKQLVKKKYLPARFAKGASQPTITKQEAIGRIAAADIERLFYPVLSPSISADTLKQNLLGDGIGAVPGAATGKVAFTAADAEQCAEAGDQVILVRKETSPEDVGGMYAAVGVLTATGGKTSHAAVVARGWGKCCIVGCEDLTINMTDRTMSLGDRTIHEGDSITLDGGTGQIYEGRMALDRPSAPPEYDTIMNWCDKTRRLAVRANADTPEDALRSVELGAEGIGLCRTEHMFFDSSQPQRLQSMRQMILANNEADRRVALDKLLPFQTEDFIGIFTAMDGHPVTVRLLDPPLHEFLPQHDNRDAQQTLADELCGSAASSPDSASDSACDSAPDGEPDGADSWQDSDGGVATIAPKTNTVTIEDIQRRVDQLHESNPMLGHRGCRLCITYPEILEMQVRAIMTAAAECTQRGIKVLPEIMIPLTIDAKELQILTDRTRAVADSVLKARNVKINYMVGTMVETPRAALCGGAMANVAEFFSFGTNDLTQMAMGLSRDDAGRFLPDYVDEDKAGIFPHDPFQTIDIDGVGKLVEMACVSGRAARPKIKLGVCGEHGGDPESIQFFERVGLDYVSCSPLRLPIARLAAAQATLATSRPAVRKASSRINAGKRVSKKPRAKAAKAKRPTAKKVKKTTARRKVKSKKRGAR